MAPILAAMVTPTQQHPMLMPLQNAPYATPTLLPTPRSALQQEPVSSLGCILQQLEDTICARELTFLNG